MPTINIDMDGVVADFITGARLYLNASQQDTDQAERDGVWPEFWWQQLKAAPHWFRTLHKMKQADSMMALAARFRDELGWDLRMLTAIPHKNDMPDVFQDKFDWMREHYPGVQVNFGPYSQDKWRHCSPGDILVDDRPENCRDWRVVGGIAVQVTSDYDLALKELTSILDQLLREGYR